jgi:hypothetical protein
VSKLIWDQTGHRFYETGVNRGVLYLPDNTGVYDTGVAWNGLTTVTESPSGAEATPQYADNIKYLNLISAEQFGATIEAFYYPDEFEECDGTASPQPGVAIGQQRRKPFGLSYQTRIGNDLDGIDHGYKIHLIYGALAAPSEKAHTTINESPEAITFSWTVTTTPVDVTGYKPTAKITIDSTKVSPTALAALEDFLYGTVGADPMLPAPDAVLALFTGSVTTATPIAPTYNSSTDVLTIPTVTGVEYRINGLPVTGGITITESTVVKAYPLNGYKFPPVCDDDWLFTFV